MPWRTWLCIAGLVGLSVSCAIRMEVPTSPFQGDEVRHHAIQRFDGRDAWVSTAFIRGNGTGGVAIRSRDQTNVVYAFDYVADLDGGRWSIRGAGMSREMNVATRASGDVSIVAIGGLSWELPESLSDEAMISVRRAIRASLAASDLHALDRIRRIMKGASYIEWIACPVEPARTDARMWRCDALTPKVESITLPPDCDFDSSVGFPCGKERKARVRAANRRGELLEKY